MRENEVPSISALNSLAPNTLAPSILAMQHVAFFWQLRGVQVTKRKHKNS